MKVNELIVSLAMVIIEVDLLSSLAAKECIEVEVTGRNECEIKELLAGIRKLDG